MLKTWTVDKLIIVSTTLCVLGEIAINFINSYGHIYVLGMKYGEAGTDARLTPIGIDLFMLVFANLNLYLARKGRYAVKANGKKRPEFRWPRWLLALGVAASVAANGAYGFWWGWTGAIIAMGSAVLLFFTVEGGMLLMRVAAEERDKRPAESILGPSGGNSEAPIILRMNDPAPAPPYEAALIPERIDMAPPWESAPEQLAPEPEGKAPPPVNTEAWRGLSGIGLSNGGRE